MTNRIEFQRIFIINRSVPISRERTWNISRSCKLSLITSWSNLLESVRVLRCLALSVFLIYESLRLCQECRQYFQKIFYFGTNKICSNIRNFIDFVRDFVEWNLDEDIFISFAVNEFLFYWIKFRNWCYNFLVKLK